MSEERRTKERTAACFPAEIEGETGETSVAMILDASVIGANLLTNEPLKLGQRVKLRMYFAADPGKARTVEGTVVRVKSTPKDREWPFQVGIQFAGAVTDVEDDIKKLADLQARLFRLRR